MHQTIFLIGVLIFSAHLFTSVSERTKIPDVLLLMIVGIIVGPLLGVVNSNYFGEFGFVITTIALIVILFDGGTHLRIASLKTGFANTVFLSLLTFVLTLAIVAVASYYIFDLNVITSLMIGAILSPISPAVVLPMISSLKMEEQGKTILVLETAITDVLAIILAFSFIQSVQSGKVEVTYIISQIGSSTIIALIIGLLGGVAWSQLLSKVRKFPNSVFTTFAAIFILYGFAEMFHYSGALTALAFGFAISNLSTLNLKKSKWLRKIEKADFIENENTFFSEIRFLLKIFFFVFLGISFPLDQLVYLGWGFGITMLLFIARLLVAKFTLPETLSVKSSAIATIMIPKGLASAVLAGIPLQRQMMYGDIVQNIVYAVILWSILLTSVFVILVERTSFQSVILKMLGKTLEAEASEEPADVAEAK